MPTRPKRLLPLFTLALAACGSNIIIDPAPRCAVPSQIISTPAGAASTRTASATTDWWSGAVVYEIFVRSFRDTDGDGIGDLAGITGKLPYLKDLGVDAIWLMPIYPSPSYHGYDVTSYTDVNPQYDPRWASGAATHASDFDSLITAAHAAGIKVVLDFVPNHSSNKHPWFLDALTSASAAHRDWYEWSPTNPGWGPPWGGSGQTWHYSNSAAAWYYSPFSSGMPDLNWENASVQQAIYDAAVGWIQRGADGFRLDAVRYLVEDLTLRNTPDLPQTHAALKSLTSSVRAARSDALVLGEAWDTTQTITGYFGSPASQASGGDEVLPFNFPLAGALAGGGPTAIAATLDAIASGYPAGSGDAPFLTNHDQVRIATVLNNDPAQLKQAAAMLLTLQGTPVIYYGEELGMQNGACGDECKRMPMAWDATANHGFTAGTPWTDYPPGAATANVAVESADPGSLLARYKQLIAVRKASTALRHGGLTRLATSGDVLAWLRSDGTETVLAAFNPGASAVSHALSLTQTGADPLFVDDCVSVSVSAGAWTLTLPAHSSGIWRVHN